MIQVGVLLAVLCALVTNVGLLFKSRGCKEAPRVEILHPVRTAVGLWASRWFAIGMALCFAGWLVHVAAISLAPLSTVQSVLAGGVVILAVMADKLFGLHVGRREWIRLALAALGLGLLAVTLPVTGDIGVAFSPTTMVALNAGIFALAGLLVWRARRGAPARRAALVAVAAGLLFTVCNVAVKALTGPVVHNGAALTELVSPWLFIAAAGSAGAFFASAKSLQDGRAVEVIAVTTTTANISSIGGGIIVFGDATPHSTIGILLRVLAFVLVIVAAGLPPLTGQPAPPERARAPRRRRSGGAQAVSCSSGDQRSIVPSPVS